MAKTEVAKVLATGLDAELIRLQRDEGLDATHAAYEWNYARQILEIRLMQACGRWTDEPKRIPAQASAVARTRQRHRSRPGPAHRRAGPGRRRIRGQLTGPVTRVRCARQ